MQAIFQKFPQKAVGESVLLMAPPWAGHHPSLPFSVTRGPLLRLHFGEHICQMTALSVYHPLWLRQIHCHGGTSHAGIDLWPTVSQGQVIYTHRRGAHARVLALDSSCRRIHGGSFGNLPSSSCQAAVSLKTCYCIPKGFNGSLV